MRRVTIVKTNNDGGHFAAMGKTLTLKGIIKKQCQHTV